MPKTTIRRAFTALLCFSAAFALGSSPASSVSAATAESHCGKLTLSQTWTGAHTITCQFTVPRNLTLTLASGSSIVFSKPIVVEGRLVADSTTFSGAAGILVDGLGQMTASNSTFTTSRLELRPSSMRGASLQVTTSTLTNTPVVAGALNRPALGMVRLSASTVKTSSVAVVTATSSDMTSNWFDTSPVKVVGASPTVTLNSFSSSSLTLGDSAVQSAVTDTNNVSLNTFSASSVALGKVALGGELDTATAISTNGAITVPTGRSITLRNTAVTGTGSWSIIGTLNLSGSSLTARSMTVGAALATNQPASLLADMSSLQGSMFLAGNSLVRVTNSTMNKAPLSIAPTTVVALQATDLVDISNTAITDSPITFRRASGASNGSVPAMLKISDSSLLRSQLEVWSSTDTVLQRSVVTSSNSRIVGAAPTIVSNSFVASSLTIGDTVAFQVLTDLANVSANTSTPSNVVTLGRTTLGGSFTGLSLSLAHVNAVATLPTSRSLVWTNTATTGPGAIALNGSLSITNGALGNTLVRAGALNTTNPQAALTLIDSALTARIELSGGIDVTLDGVTAVNAAVVVSPSPTSALRATDSLEIIDATLTNSAIRITKTNGLYSLPVSITTSTLSSGTLNIASNAAVSLTGSSIANTATRIVGGVPTIASNTISGTTTFALGDAAYDKSFVTDLSQLRANTSPGVANRFASLGNVLLTSTTDFSGFAGLNLPSALATVTVPEGLTVTLPSIGITGIGTMRVFGSLTITDAAISVANLQLGSTSSTGSTASLGITRGTISSSIVLDGGSQLAIDSSTLSLARLSYNTKTVAPARPTDAVSITNSNINGTTADLRRFSPDPVSAINTTITNSTVTASSFRVWSNANVDISNNSFTGSSLLVIGGAPTVDSNAFAGTGSVVFGDPLTATSQVTDLSNVRANTASGAATSALRTLSFGLVDIGSMQLNGALGFSKVQTTLRPVVANPTSNASLSNVTIVGQAPWTMTGRVTISDSTLTAPNMTAATATGLVILRNVSTTAGVLSSNNTGELRLEASTLTRTALTAGAPFTRIPLRSSTPGTVSATDSTLANVVVTVVDSSRFDATGTTLNSSPVTTMQNAVMNFTNASFNASPIAAVKTSVTAQATTFNGSTVALIGGSLTLNPSTKFTISANATGATLTNAALVINGTTAEPVVFTGVCDPTNTALAACATQSESMRPKAGVSLNDRSTITANHAVFAFARTGVFLDAYTVGVGQNALETTTTGIRDSDFVLTDTAVAFSPNWRAADCRYESYVPVADAYFSTPHGWNVNITPGASSALRSLTNGIIDYSGMLRGQVTSAFTTESWLQRLTTTAPAAWAPPVPSYSSYSSFVLQTVLSPQTSAPASRQKNTNNLPYNVELCSLPVPTTPTASSQGIPVALARLTTPAIPWSTTTQDVELDGVAIAHHAYTAAVESAMGLDVTRSTNFVSSSLYPFLSLPHSELQQRFKERLADPAALPVAAVENVALSRLRENDPLLSMTWRAHPDARVVAYHIYVSQDNGPFVRFTPTLGIPGRFVALSRIECHFTVDCKVAVSAIASDGSEGALSAVAHRPKSSFAQ